MLISYAIAGFINETFIADGPTRGGLISPDKNSYEF